MVVLRDDFQDGKIVRVGCLFQELLLATIQYITFRHLERRGTWNLQNAGHTRLCKGSQMLWQGQRTLEEPLEDVVGVRLCCGGTMQNWQLNSGTESGSSLEVLWSHQLTVQWYFRIKKFGFIKKATEDKVIFLFLQQTLMHTYLEWCVIPLFASQGVDRREKIKTNYDLGGELDAL